MEDPGVKLENFFKLNRPTTHRKGDVVLGASDVSSFVYYLSKGYIKDSAVSKEGAEYTLFIFKPADIFPYNWAFNKLPNEHSFSAITDCVIYKCQRDDFLKFIKSDPEVLFMLTQRVLIRLRGVLQRLEYSAFGNAYKRVASIYIILSERFGVSTPDGIKISFPLSHQDIAELVGVTRETASIEVKRLESEGLIIRKHKFYILPSILRLQRKSDLYI